MARSELEILINADDRASDKLKKLQNELRTLSMNARRVGMALTGIGGSIVGVSVLTLKSYNDLGKEITKLGKETGRTVEELAALKGITVETAKGAVEFSRKTESLTSSLNGLKYAVADGLLPALKPMMDSVIQMINGFAALAKSNPELIQNFVKLGLVLSIGGAVLLGFSVLANAMSGIIGLGRTLTGVFAGGVTPALKGAGAAGAGAAGGMGRMGNLFSSLGIGLGIGMMAWGIERVISDNIKNQGIRAYNTQLQQFMGQKTTTLEEARAQIQAYSPYRGQNPALDKWMDELGKMADEAEKTAEATEKLRLANYEATTAFQQTSLSIRSMTALNAMLASAGLPQYAMEMQAGGFTDYWKRAQTAAYAANPTEQLKGAAFGALGTHWATKLASMGAPDFSFIPNIAQYRGTEEYFKSQGGGAPQGYAWNIPMQVEVKVYLNEEKTAENLVDRLDYTFGDRYNKATASGGGGPS